MITPIEFTFHQWMDASQSLAMFCIVFTQLAILWAIRSEMRRAVSAQAVMSRALGEASDMARRVEQLEDDVADLTMRLEQYAR